jgi:hypothetical protein
VDARDIQVVDDIRDRLANGRPPEDGEYAHMTGDDSLTDDDFYDRYELGEQTGDPRHERGLKFQLRDSVTRQKYVITVQAVR